MAVSPLCRSLAAGLVAASLAGFAVGVWALGRRPPPYAAMPDEASSAPPPAPPAEPRAAKELRAGLLADYDALLRRVDPQLNFAPTDGPFAGAGLKGIFQVRWEGLLRVPQVGRYGFTALAGGEVRLFLGGRLVLEGAAETRGEAELPAGDHALRIEYAHRDGPAALSLLWEGPGIPRDVIPETALFHLR
jgi:hypothetical protein